MQHPGRGGRGEQNPRGGGGMFPGFGDPFAAFGRPNFLTDMFDNDPFFNDPFFTRPFGSLLGNSGGLFGPGSFFGPSPFPQAGFPNNGRQIFIDQRPSNPQPEAPRRGVHIEELPEDHDIGEGAGPSTNREPIVEHPDDEAGESTDLTPYQPEVRTHRSRDTNVAPRQQSANAPFTYSYQSSSVTYGGANGPYYAAHSSRRRGPDGVYEEEHAEKDITSGREHHHVVHGLGNKGRALTRKRNAEGREEKFEMLHNLAEDEVHGFERTWETQAQQAFPRHRSSSQRLGSGSGSGTRSRAALPSSDGPASIQDLDRVPNPEPRPVSSQGVRPASRQGSTQSPKKVSKSSLKSGSKGGPNLTSSSAPKKNVAEVGQPGPSTVFGARSEPPASTGVQPRGEQKSYKRDTRRDSTD
ncbi:hypothetical protein R1sor_011482 [Riccia sorocarpa]|uniref:Myeloid leukemia factor n=1 Tax=Riccia sorocarpa TaxID=122646 RepID=A0ABD3I594_9MARC